MEEINKSIKLYKAMGVILLCLWIISLIPSVFRFLSGYSYLEFGLGAILKSLILIMGIFFFVFANSLTKILEFMVKQDEKINSNYIKIRKLEELNTKQ